ncbi:MAG: ATP-binding protein [Bacteroidota bacterium]|nr:ATP-binding protein [Bacteroidota bacterium]
MFSNQNLREILLKEGEGEKLDFKQEITDKYKIAKTIVSFANNKGGINLVGVKDDKTVINIDPEEEKFMINEAALYFCDPPVSVDFEELEDEETGHTVLMVKIHESKFKPHASKVKDNDWRIYIRQSDKSILASQMNVAMMKKGIDESKNIKPLTALERNLLIFLQSHQRITLKQTMKFFNLSKRRAQRILTAMVLDGNLKVHDFEKEQFYTS